MALALVPHRPSTPTLALARRTADFALSNRPTSDLVRQMGMWPPGGPSLLRVRVDLYLTWREYAFLLLVLWILSRYL